MPYSYSEHALNEKDGPIDRRGRAEYEDHELLESQGYWFQIGRDYYCYGNDADWEQDPFCRPSIYVYPDSKTWDGSNLPIPVVRGTELRVFLQHARSAVKPST